MSVEQSISIVTPSYNQGIYIERTIKSVLEQNLKPKEHLVFDGGSTDNTRDVLEKYADSLTWDSRKDNGQSDAVNKGLTAAKGNIIGWLNSDDIYYPGALEAVTKAFAENPDVDIIYGHANHIDSEDVVLEKYPTENWNFENLLDRCFICQPATFFRRSLIDRIGPLDQDLKYSMDYELWIRAGLANARFLMIPEILAGSRLHADTKTLGSTVAVHKEISKMLATKLGKTPDRWLANYAHVYLRGKGIQDQSPWFRILLPIVTGISAIENNGTVSMPQLKEMGSWFKSGIKSLVSKS